MAVYTDLTSLDLQGAVEKSGATSRSSAVQAKRA